MLNSLPLHGKKGSALGVAYQYAHRGPQVPATATRTILYPISMEGGLTWTIVSIYAGPTIN